MNSRRWRAHATSSATPPSTRAAPAATPTAAGDPRNSSTITPSIHAAAASDSGERMATGTGSRRRYSHIAEPENARYSANMTFIHVRPGSATNTVVRPNASATTARIRIGLNTTDEISRGVCTVATAPV